MPSACIRHALRGSEHHWPELTASVILLIAGPSKLVWSIRGSVLVASAGKRGEPSQSRLWLTVVSDDVGLASRCFVAGPRFLMPVRSLSLTEGGAAIPIDTLASCRSYARGRERRVGRRRPAPAYRTLTTTLPSAIAHIQQQQQQQRQQQPRLDVDRGRGRSCGPLIRDPLDNLHRDQVRLAVLTPRPLASCAA